MKNELLANDDQSVFGATLRLLEVDFEAGNKFSLMAAICECAEAGVALSNWVAIGYVAAFEKVHPSSTPNPVFASFCGPSLYRIKHLQSMV